MSRCTCRRYHHRVDLRQLLDVHRIPAYDDEGLFLYALRNCFAGHALYDEMSTQAGPAYFFVNFLAFAGDESLVTHDAVRRLTAFLWCIGSMLMGLVALKETRSTSAGILELLMSLSVATVVANEPGHPQAMLYVLTTASFLAICFVPARWAIVLLGSYVGIAAAIRSMLEYFSSRLACGRILTLPVRNGLYGS